MPGTGEWSCCLSLVLVPWAGIWSWRRHLVLESRAGGCSRSRSLGAGDLRLSGIAYQVDVGPVDSLDDAVLEGPYGL